MAEPTMSTLAGTLVQRGWPKVDLPHGCLPKGPSWAFRAYSHNEPGPRSVISLWIPGGDEDHDLAIAVSSCECCEAITRVQWFDPASNDLIAEVRYWPGLDDCVDMGRMFLDQLIDHLQSKTA
jgi:hypothetical protein